MSRRRRWKRKLVLCAAAGFIANIAVSWILAMSIYPWNGDATDWDTNPPEWSMPVRPDWPDRPGSRSVYHAFGIEAISEWADPHVFDSFDLVTVSAGWPLRALRSHTWTWERHSADAFFKLDEPIGRRASSPLPIPPFLRNGSGVVVLPIEPLWPGFALNTAFCGTLAFLLWSAPGLVRRTRRRRRGLCVACGYELKGMQKCPECGRQ